MAGEGGRKRRSARLLIFTPLNTTAAVQPLVYTVFSSTTRYRDDSRIYYLLLLVLLYIFFPPFSFSDLFSSSRVTAVYSIERCPRVSHGGNDESIPDWMAPVAAAPSSLPPKKCQEPKWEKEPGDSSEHRDIYIYMERERIDQKSLTKRE